MDASSDASSRTVRLRLPGGGTAVVPESAVQPDENGRLCLTVSLAEEPSTPEAATSSQAESPPSELVIPLVEERMRTSTRSVETGRVRVHKRVESREEIAQLELARETVEVERVPIDRVVEAPPPIRTEGDRTVVPVLEEVLVVEKKLVLREEVHLIRRRTTESEAQPVTLRRETIEVERHPQEDA